jgi:hypothetical protein
MDDRPHGFSPGANPAVRRPCIDEPIMRPGCDNLRDTFASQRSSSLVAAS